MPEKKTEFMRTCKRCNKIFRTEHRRAKICPNCYHKKKRVKISGYCHKCKKKTLGSNFCQRCWTRRR